MTHKAFAQIAKSHESYTFQTTYFDLPEQPLHQCLMEFAIQSKLSIIVRRDMLMGLRSRPIVGPYSPQSALSQILARSPLSFRIQGKAIVIEQRHAAMDKLPPVKTNQRQIPDEEVIVKSQVLPYRYNTISQTQFYGGMSSFDLARFVSVIPNQLLLDQASEDVGEALKNSSAVTPGDGQADTNDDFYVRGFRRYGIHIDGFRLSTTVGVKQLPETIERIEVLKGPSTLFFGQSEPGGIVNIVRKKPTLKSHKILNMVAGTDAKQHLALDVNSAIPGSQNTALFRFIGARETRDRFRNLTEIERDLIAPSFTWSPTQETTFELGYEAQKTRQTLQQGTVLLAPLGSDGQQNIIALDAAPRLAQPEYTAKYQLYNIGVRQQFSEHWAVKGQYFHHSHHNQGVRSNRDTLLTSGILLDEDDLNPTTVPIIVGGIVIPINTGTDITNPVDPDNFKATVLSLFDEEQREDSQTLRFRLDGKNLFDQLNYTISLGADWYTQEKNDRFVLEERSDIISLTQLDPSQSQIDAIVAGVFNDTDEQGELTSRQQILQFDEYGAFIFNSVNISQQWQVSLGGRYTLTQAQVAPNNSTDFIELQKYREFSADGGIRFEPFEDIAIYVNYSEGIKANYQIDDFATVFDAPERSQQVELGIKSFLFGGRVISTLAAYQIDKENIVSIEFTNGLRQARLGGEQRSTGLDIDTTVELSDHINLIGAFSALDATFKTGPNVGMRPRLTSQYSGSIFTRYEAKKGLLENLTLLAGINYVGERFADDENTFTIDGYAVSEVGVLYTLPFKHWLLRTQINIKNVFDKPHILSNEGNIRITEGEGRNTQLTLSLRF